MSAPDHPSPPGWTARIHRHVDLKLLLAVLVLVAGEIWYLLTQATEPLVPAIWMLPMATLLLLYAIDRSLSFVTVTAVLFSGRLLFLPFFVLLVPIDSYLLFYLLFMAPVDLLALQYAVQSARPRVRVRTQSAE